jgi:outer membrane protein TolC
MRRLPILTGLTLVLMAASRAPAGEVPPGPLRLADCLALAHERQPALVVARARLAAAEAKLCGLEAMGVPAEVLHRDLPIRRQQARLGVEINRVGLMRLEDDTRYEVTRAYLSVLYARAQGRVIDDLIDELTYLRERVRVAVGKSERPEWTEASVDLITLRLRRAQGRRAEAERGREVAALREATGVGPGACLVVADEPLPRPEVRVCRAEVVAAALARRGEAQQADAATEVVGLEAQAQARVCRPASVPTFAAGADIHAGLVPQPMYGTEYRPAGMPLAMPTALAGPRPARVEAAHDFSVQAAAVAEKTRNLVALEAEEAYFTWEEWSRKAAVYGDAEGVGARLSRTLREEIRGPLKRVLDTVLPESQLLAQTRADYNEALFRQAVALAELERVTAGGFCAGLADLPPVAHPELPGGVP